MRAPAMQRCEPMEGESICGYVNSVETFGSVDGPGVRFVAFLQGCPMRCRYCHNPETWSPGGADGAEQYTAQALFAHAYRYRSYWGKKGGVTLSGGEPLLQLDFVTEVFRLAHEKGVHTALDTSGAPFEPDAPGYLARVDRLLQYTDLVILDLKEFDAAKHKALTGRPNDNILAMAAYLSAKGVPLWIRHVLVPGLTDDEAGLRALDEFIATLSTVERVEILPYHALALPKWQKLGIPYTLGDAQSPTEAQVHRAEALLHVDSYPRK